MELICAKFEKDLGDSFSVKDDTNKIYLFSKIAYYDNKRNIINEYDLTGKSVYFIPIDFKIKSEEYNYKRLIHIKGEGNFLVAEYSNSFRAEVKTIDVDSEEEFMEKIKAMGGITLEEYLKSMKNK